MKARHHRLFLEAMTDGDFMQKCAEAFYGEKQITDLLLKSATVRASNYMRLARAQ